MLTNVIFKLLAQYDAFIKLPQNFLIKLNKDSHCCFVAVGLAVTNTIKFLARKCNTQYTIIA